MKVPNKATNIGEKIARNNGMVTRHFATSLSIAKGVPIRAGDTVERITDNAVFLVTEVSPYGLRLEGETSNFNPIGFRIVSPRKHR